MVTYIGIDMAWSSRHRSGAAALIGGADGARVMALTTLGGDDAILAFVLAHAGDGPALVAVDAPLVVPNATGRRAGDAALSAAFRRYEAGAHPANRSLPSFQDGGRGAQLVEALQRHGFAHEAAVAARSGGRQVFECYPHPAMIAIFELERTLKYKARGHRDRATRLAAWQAYHTHLRALAHADPPLHGHEPLLAADAELGGLPEVRLKAYEDTIDALFCAYIALYADRWGMERCRTFGSLAEGYIFTPVPPALR